MAPISHLRARCFGMTDPGQVRPANEDNFLVAELGRTLWIRQTSLPQPPRYHARSRGQLLLVADGMGGHQAGEVASALSVETVEAFVLELLRRFSNLNPADDQGVLADLRDALRQADARIFEESVQNPELAGMGTTLTVAFASGRRLFVLHAGDSRCYLYRAGRLEQLTEDHTVAAELTRRGMITPEEAKHHRSRHVVTNILGGGHPGVRAEVRRVELEAGDAILLCSDGLTEMVVEDRIALVLTEEEEPEAACRRLITEANQSGGRDNITVVVARFEAESA